MTNYSISLFGVSLLLACSSTGLATEPASRKGVAYVETRRDLSPCLSMIDPIPCAVEAGFECSLENNTEGSEYVCRREHPTGFVVVQLSQGETGWRSYLNWVSNSKSNE